MKKLIAIILLTITATITGSNYGAAQETGTYPYYKTTAASFDEVFTELQDVIINEGLVIDFIGNVDDMLMRTSEAASSVTSDGQKSPYLHAKYLQFCSAKLTHMAVSADPHNLAICPYVFFIYETHSNPGNVTVGFRPPLFGPSKRSGKIKTQVIEFLQEIIDKTISG